MEAFSAQSNHAGETSRRPHRVTVTTTARLHFGFLDPSGRGARPFGSFGLSLDRPGTRLTLARAERLAVTGPERIRAARYLKTIAESCGIDRAYDLGIAEAIPSHAGLGSGTQLALAVGSAFAALEGLRLEPQEIAARLGRGLRSGIGIATFAHGGLVLDGGPRHGALPELIGRLPFPPDWRVILMFDADANGLAGASEAAAFDTLPDFPPSETEALYRRIADGAFAAAAEADFTTFCEQVGYLQACMGAYFAPLQGGPYTSPQVSEVLAWLGAQSVTGLGQSSWGPTGFAFFASERAGEAVMAEAQVRARRGKLSFDLARGRNEGAKIETSGTEIR
jgi:beta-RFAP synthase